MKKRVLSALLALCMACTLAGTVWAAEETVPTPTPDSTVETQTAEPTPTPSEEPTPTPDATEEPEATAEPSATPDTTAEPDTTPEPTEEPETTETPVPSEDPEEPPVPTAEAEGEPVDGGVEYTAALEQDGQTLNVIVTASEGAFDEGVEPKLSVSAIEDEAALDAIAGELEGNVEYDGFAALDISFKNEAEAGEEVEPNAPVKVRIELPDSIVDSGIDLSTLAVQHLAENAYGDVTSVDPVASVADGTIALSAEAQAAMEQAAAEANAANGIAPMNEAPAANAPSAGDGTTDEAAAVAEFEVSSFSTFTITWTNRLIYGDNVGSLSITVCDVNGKPIGNDSDYTISGWMGDPDTDSQSVQSLARQIKGVDDYDFQYAAISTHNGTKITALKLVQNGRDYKIQYQLESGKWSDLGNQKVYFVFQEVDNRKVIETLDTDSLGINISLFDYEKSAVKNGGKYLGEFDFGASGNGDRNENQWWNDWYSGIGATQGIMKPTLDEDGYPQFVDVINGSEPSDNEKAAWLFTPTDVPNARTAYTDLNHLFIDQGGYFYFNSGENFASITDEYGDNGSYADGDHDFVVFDEATNNKAKFVPFNNLRSNYNLKENANYLFGMQVDFNFIQPQGGKIEDTPMVFEFGGDDDVWVYIDGVLVLDIGGVHGSISGQINFAEGTVTVNNVKGEGGEQVKDLKDIFEEALPAEEFNKIEWVETHVNGQTYHTFADLTDHEFKFFYLERGEGDSNCMMRFNIPTIPTDSIAVSKRVVGDAPADVTSYTMSIEIENLDEIRATDAYKDFDYDDITWNAADGEEKSLGENNTFTVAAGQTVYLNNIPANARYKISERDVSEAASVTINGVNKTPTEGTTATSDVYSMTETKAVAVTNTYPVQPPEGFGITTGKTAIRDTSDPTQYELSLSMTGDRDQEDPSATPVDILFIVDRSGSMTSSIGSGDKTSRISAVRSAVTTLVNSIEAQGNLLDPRYNVVAFSRKNANYQYPGTDTITNGWKENGQQVVNAVNNMVTGGGTNWEAAIQEGNQQLQSIIQANKQNGRDAEQIVIFLSDGVPTFYGNDDGYGSDDYMSDALIKDYKDEAVDDVAVMPCDRFYAIGVGPDFDRTSDIGYICMDDLRNQAKNATQTNIFAATDSEVLSNIFSDIAESLTFFSCVDVTMTDQLSQWADLSQEQGNVSFTVQLERYDNAEHDYVVIDPAQSVKAGVSATFDANNAAYSDYLEETVVITPSVKYPEGEQPIITAAITGVNDREYEIEPGLRYTVKTMITPSEKAITTFEEQGEDAYAATGESNTGTHAGDKGYLSNNESNAQVSYNVKVTTDGVTSELPGTEPFPKPVIQVDSSLVKPTSAELTLSKTFDGLTDEDVYFLLFGQYKLPENPSNKDYEDYYEANFSFDVNFCDTAMKENGDHEDRWMVSTGENKSDISLEGFTKPGTEEKVTTGDHFKVYAAKCLNDPGSAEELASASDEQMGATLTKDIDGNWVYTQTITIPTTPEDEATEDEEGYRYFYTVYELHGELPGYAKLDPDSAVYTVQLNKQSDGSYEHTWNGLGKFVQANANYSNINRDDALVNMTNEDEQNGIANNELARLHITGDTIISFTNHYTDSLSVQKDVTENGKTPTDEFLTELGNKEYTVKIEPADSSKLVTSSGTNAKNGLGPDWASKLAGTEITVEREGTTTHTEKVMFNEDGEIILELYRGEQITLKDIPAVNYCITEISPEGESSTFYDTDNYYLAGTYFTETYNQKVDNGPRDTQYDQSGACTKPEKDNQGPDHWNQYDANDSYGYSDANAQAKTQDGVVSVDVQTGSNDTSVDVTLTNDYEHFKTVTITKQVGGELGAKDAAFDFTTNVARNINEISYANGINSSTVSDDAMSLVNGAESVGSVTVTNSRTEENAINLNGYQLSHDDVLTIAKLKKGDVITIAETEANQNGYDTSYAINGATDKTPYGSSIIVTLDDDTLADVDDNEISVVVYNDQSVVTPTGLESNHTSPYTLMVTAAGIAGLALIGAVVNRRLRRRREE